MLTERQTILSLIAAGRINAAEAERLLVLSEDRAEVVWALVACVAAAFMMQSQPHALLIDLLDYFRSLLSGILAVANDAQHVVTQLSGGVL